MTRRTSIVQSVGNYFASKGKVMTAEEYKSQPDVPVRFQVVKRTIGSWSRLINMIGDIKQYDGAANTEEEVIEEIVKTPTVAEKK